MKIAVVAALLSSLCAAADSDYADPKSCATCHSKIAASYAQTGMGRSFYKPDQFLTGSYYHAPSDTHFTMLERDGKYYQRRYQTDPDHKEVNVDEKQIDFVMGSGNHVRTYLHRTATGALQELPLAWYSEREGYWAMNPGYDTPIQPNSRRKIGYDCMFCHNAYPEVPSGHGQLRAEPVFSGTLPEGIDCQRCHGPGRRHVELARSSGAPSQAIRESIVNPGRLSPDRQMEVCAQCHLETDSFPFPHSIQKYNRGPFSYHPGEPLSNFMLFFDHAPANRLDDRFQIVNSVYRMRMSACFLKSNAGESNKGLKCTTCHDPHESSRTQESYNNVCRQCHAALAAQISSWRHTASPDCVACHMPKRRTDDVVHAVMTDHYIQRRKADRDLLAKIPEPHGPEIIYRGEVIPYELSTDRATTAKTPENELYLALAQVREENNLQSGLIGLAEAIKKLRPEQAEFFVEFADALVKAGRPSLAIAQYKEALLRKPDSLAAILGLGDALDKSGDGGLAVEAFQQATKLDSSSATSWRQLGETQMKLGRGTDAVTSLKKSLELDRDVPEAHYALATLLGDPMAGRPGDLAGAEASFKEAIRLQPDYAAAHMNLAILLFRGNHPKEARDHFESAIRYHPEYALGHYNFGLMLIAQNRTGEAVHELELALTPGSSLPPKTREEASKKLTELRKPR